MLHDSCPCEGSVSGCQTGSAQHKRSAGLRCRIVPGSVLAHTSALQTQSDRHDACARYRLLLRRRRRRRRRPSVVSSKPCLLALPLPSPPQPPLPPLPSLPSACSPILSVWPILSVPQRTPNLAADPIVARAQQVASSAKRRLHPPPPLVFCLSPPLPDAHVCATTKLSPSANRTQSHTTGPARPRCTYKTQHRPSWPPSRPCIPATLVVDPDAFPAWRATSLLRIAHLLWLERSDQHHHQHHHCHSPPPTSTLPLHPEFASPRPTDGTPAYPTTTLISPHTFDLLFFPTTTTTTTTAATAATATAAALLFFVFTAATTLYTPSSHTSHCALR
ncbi:hypothetical protein COCMIDRAFT_26169 [Bipolaris oryzae ATCC 44560]|uniref:Uncharacterized protein n=1 Tax=Bipolaris oryzae ATCC 44560 TaxID=930090 RepID=W6ZE27_COCMI|nr:uncharacterized protein COCMIDRAFT_26169 [Bipolaris oryzae ATCC 44560]EUC45719.1 hypothetical protein COCMIDRAFT_26169 [Bipolaris oryzae ATCC 44560]